MSGPCFCSDRLVLEAPFVDPFGLRCLFCSNEVVVCGFSGDTDWEVRIIRFFAFIHLSPTGGEAVQLGRHVTSLRRVVALLQDVAKKVTEEVRQEEKKTRRRPPKLRLEKVPSRN